jgi:hypothetical protein
MLQGGANGMHELESSNKAEEESVIPRTRANICKNKNKNKK